MVSNRENIDFLLTADPLEFSLEEAMEADLELSSALDDINFQINDVPQEEFQGKDYKKWRMGACYKRGKIASAYKRFRNRVNLLLEDTKSKKYLTLIAGLVHHDPIAFQAAEHELKQLGLL